MKKWCNVFLGRGGMWIKWQGLTASNKDAGGTTAFLRGETGENQQQEQRVVYQSRFPWAVTPNLPKGKFYFAVTFHNLPLIWVSQWQHSWRSSVAHLVFMWWCRNCFWLLPFYRVSYSWCCSPSPYPGTDTLKRATQTVSVCGACISIYDSFLFCTAENLSSAVSGNDRL